MSFENGNNNAVPTNGTPTKIKKGNPGKNMSGKGSKYPVPNAVSKKFNWGAFTLTWIWGLGNSTYITLLIFATFLFAWIPIVNLIVSLGLCIWFGIKGNTWAWQNKHFVSIASFHKYQKKWAIASIIYWIITLVVIPIIIFLFTFLITKPAIDKTSLVEKNILIKKSILVIKQTTSFSKATGQKCNLSSEDIATCFNGIIKGNLNRNIINAPDGTKWIFYSNGICKNNNDCNITVKFKNKNLVIIPVYADNNGFLYARENDLNKYLEESNKNGK